MKVINKRPVIATMVKLLFHQQTNRGMELIEHRTRCIRQHEIVELVVTDQQDLSYPARVDRVGFLGFAEIQQGGIIEAGDSVIVNDITIGTVSGFDACHCPNHYNVIITASDCLTAQNINLKIMDSIQFK